MSKKAVRWKMVQGSTTLEPCEFTLPEPGSGEALIRIAGCGVCHTDLGFLFGGVRTRKSAPLTLGHEIAGTVLSIGPGTELDSGIPLEPGMAVIIPAVIPCGECSRCRAGRDNICADQKMPGNDFDGGFATHILVPGRFLIPVDPIPAEHHLRDLAVVADAVTTPYQAMIRGRVGPGDKVIIIGAGGIGIYGVQIATALGAQVLAVDIDETRIRRAREYGASAGICTAGLAERDSRQAIREEAERAGWDREGWKIFEMSGTPSGQQIGFSLLNYTGILGVIGFTREKITIRLSNLMAFDADAFGSWACSPRHYPKVLEWIRKGSIRVQPFVTFRPLGEVNQVLDQAHRGEFPERAVLVPEE